MWQKRETKVIEVAGLPPGRENRVLMIQYLNSEFSRIKHCTNLSEFV